MLDMQLSFLRILGFKGFLVSFSKDFWDLRDSCSGGFAIRPHSRPLKRGGWEGIVILLTSNF